MTSELRQAPELQTSEWLNTPEPITLDALAGRVVVIEAFQMLCPGCVSHGLPQAARIREAFSEADVAVLGLHSVFEHHAAQGSAVALKAFLHEYRIEFPVAIDEVEEGARLPKTMSTYQLRGTPSLILIDRQGRYSNQWFGSVSDLVVGAFVMKLILDQSANIRC